MDYIHKLPFILGASVTILIGIISSKGNAEPKEIYFRMLVTMVVFFIMGIYIRKSLYKIYEDIEKKKEEQRRLEEMQNQDSMESNTEMNNDENVANTSRVDYRVDNDGEDFTPFNINSYSEHQDK